MAFDQLTRTLTHCVGLIFDRSVESEKQLGQAFLVAPNRAIVTASSVFQYADCPTALAVRFPYVDSSMSVKAIAIHPSFNKQAARASYLSQTGLPGEQMPLIDYDMALLLLDNSIGAIPADKLTQLNGLLSLTTPISEQDMFGVMADGEAVNVIERIVATGQSGLLAFLDSRNVPFARFKVEAGRLSKIIYKDMASELAFFEMVYRNPAGKYLFTSSDQFAWPNIREIAISAQQLIAEGQRRAHNLPNILNSLGGADARYQIVSRDTDVSSINENVRWAAERLIQVLDGYITVDRLAERIGADTFTACWALQEMITYGLAQLNKVNPFLGSGQLGPTLPPAGEMSTWDEVIAFYLDPVSQRPILQKGMYFGMTKAQDAKLLLHTANVPPSINGAVLIRNGTVAGINSGFYAPQEGSQASNEKLFQMVSLSGVQDLGGRRRATSDVLSQSMTNLPGGGSLGANPDYVPGDTLDPSSIRGMIGRIICPNCQETNYEAGLCVNCGTDLTSPDDQGVSGRPGSFKPSQVLKQHAMLSGLTKTQKIILGVILLLGSAGMVIISSPKHDVPNTQNPAGGNSSSTTISDGANQNSNLGALPEGMIESKEAAKLAQEFAGFAETPPAPYVYIDAVKLTGVPKSFGLVAPKQNQKVLFFVWDNEGPAEDLDLILHKVPFTNYESVPNIKDVLVTQGENPIAKGLMKWFAGRYFDTKTNAKVLTFVGAFKSPQAGKAIVVIGTPLKEQENYDFNTAIWLVDTLSKPNAESGAMSDMQSDKASGTNEEEALASFEEVEKYAASVQALLSAKYHATKDTEKLKSKVLFHIDQAGTISKVEITETSGNDAFDQRIVALINSNQPYEKAPLTNDKLLSLEVKISGGKLTVSPVE